MDDQLRPVLAFTLVGEPVPYRYELVGPPNARRIADAKRYRQWKADAVARLKRWAIEVKPSIPVRVPVVFAVASWLDRPRKMQTFATIEGQPVAVPEGWRGPGRVPCLAPGDATNLGKAAEDAVVQAGLLLDDRLCVEVQTRRGYAAAGEPGCVEVQLFDAVAWYGWTL